ncbi:uncharacterized protein LOC113355984 [Papaver somniferum]|uniref:uncharacterized protein LOC113355984 n=1 Tax=Papaver somniferum TaxID=3469 RepID=UPI000E6F7920|nr:uncharacterized protein LOC113355984 [Papaver somniferum]
MMMMEISGVPPDLCLQIFCIAVFITLSLIYVFSSNSSNDNSESKTFVYIPDDDDEEINNNTINDGDRGSRNGNNNSINQIITITRTIRDCCSVCGDTANSRCSRCKAIRYCSRDCQIQHWRAGHKLECKEDSSRTSCNERKPSVYMDTICSYQQSRKDEASVEEKGPSERNLVEELKIVEECPICISRIRLSKQSRPSVSCDTCKHKFHLSCISKWFSISKNSICPLCGCKFKPGGLLQLTAAKKS